MILEYGNLIAGRSIVVKSAVLPDGKPFMDPGALGGSGLNKKRPTWRQMPTKIVGASGDHRGLPEWVEFAWQEPAYPGKKPENFPDREAFALYVKESYDNLPVQRERLYIRSRVPEEVVREVVASKRQTSKGKLADKALWIYIFWTIDGIRMRWEMTARTGSGGFGPVIQQGGDDLDRYNW